MCVKVDLHTHGDKKRWGRVWKTLSKYFASSRCPHDKKWTPDIFCCTLYQINKVFYILCVYSQLTISRTLRRGPETKFDIPSSYSAWIDAKGTETFVRGRAKFEIPTSSRESRVDCIRDKRYKETNIIQNNDGQKYYLLTWRKIKLNPNPDLSWTGSVVPVLLWQVP